VLLENTAVANCQDLPIQGLSVSADVLRGASTLAETTKDSNAILHVTC
jgi:hypothetical protein